MKPSELGAWIRAMMAQQADRFLLAQLGWTERGEAQAPIRLFVGDDAGRANELAKEALEAAREDAADTGGRQRYALIAQASGEAIGRRIWTLHGAAISLDGTSSEPPNAIGQVAMLMRHVETEHRTKAQREDASFGVLERTIERLERENAQLREREDKRSQLLEELQSLAHERTLAMQEQTSRLELRSRALTRLEPMIAMLGAKLFSLPLAPGDQASSALDALLASITPEQATKLSGVLTPEQIVSLEQLYKEGAKRQAAKEEAEAAERRKQEEAKAEGAAAA